MNSTPARAAQTRGVTFSPLACQTILNRCDSPQMPFVWTINPYRGCEFACAYCYARYTHEFLGAKDPAAFETEIYVKEHVAMALRRDLARRVEPGEAIAIGTATDPYQPAERSYRATRALLEVFARQGTVDAKEDLLVVRAALLLRLMEEPQPLLAEGEGQLAVARNSSDGLVGTLDEPLQKAQDLGLALPDLGA